MASQTKTSVNSFGYFLEEVNKGGSASAGTKDCIPGECDDPQLQVLKAIKEQPDAPCTLDLMKATHLPPTLLLATLRTMKEFGLIKVFERAVTGSEPTQFFQLTPSGLGAIEIYRK